ncbi:hypothetical protein TNCV_1863441 [Trichonephila clavipes]|nr:hypothetical protein TNCV_1863441 [Trichonephila clavipes]
MNKCTCRHSWVSIENEVVCRRLIKSVRTSTTFRYTKSLKLPNKERKSSGGRVGDGISHRKRAQRLIKWPDYNISSQSQQHRNVPHSE